ncbi:TAXI family TRAP transporter solute-binding subunit [Curvivirga aplysinae]|uniref:TAXI family TRAP transporter solute-binding subunit n=1 Tax=Curvivirga aplysinae TaxID=2529852 RepID=UPI0012BBF0EB|nr:TAXI family TRAP transporter solute-binding subunit [Curvivirga aplysinae]MTI10682.1 TAXI family TRAP transporter solute-binding subunit [Curvivirga aplysinae]
MFLRKLALSAVASAALMTTAVAADTQHVVIGTGGQTGVYYQVGGAICRLVNKGTADHGINCTHKTGGSVTNINGIRSGDVDMGVAQSDWQYHGYNGTAPDKFPDGAFKELRAVFSVHPEPFTVVARADADIKTFEDLKGKKVNVGNPGSGQRGTMEVVMEKMGWTMGDFAVASELKSSEQAAALCDGKVDAIIFTAGHPNGSIKEATTSCDAVLVPVDNDVAKKLASDNDYYAMTEIPAGMYKGTDTPTATFGVGATFVSSTKASEETVYQMVKAVFENFKRFKKMHPAFGHLKEENMIVNNLSAPLHDGAVRYYKERGWM